MIDPHEQVLIDVLGDLDGARLLAGVAGLGYPRWTLAVTGGIS